MEKTLTNKVKLNSFINLFCQLFLNVNKLFSDLQSNKIKLEIFDKGIDDKFTNIDWSVQKMIENYLNHYYPNIKFIGEENTKVEKVKPEFSEFLTKVDEILFQPICEDLITDNSKYEEKDLCIYCDPIDSTGSFIKGKYAPVTCLVGVTYKGVPILGFIHFLSYKNSEPITFFNNPGKGIYSVSVDANSASLENS